MEVLVSNDPMAADKQYEVVCTACNSLLRFRRSEAIREEETKTAKVLVVTCPVCAQEVKKTINNKIEEALVVSERHYHLPQVPSK